jgi:hypothetical protein
MKQSKKTKVGARVKQARHTDLIEINDNITRGLLQMEKDTRGFASLLCAALTE